MPRVMTARGPVTFSVLIPTRDRAEVLAKTLGKMPWLHDPGTVIGVDTRSGTAYRELTRQYPRITWVSVDNPTGSVAVAREQLRRDAVLMHASDWYVVTDDNAIHASQEALHALVRAAAEYPDQPVVMAGMHNTAPHFDRGKIGQKRTIRGLRSYPTVAMIFQVYPAALYTKYQYPPDAYGLDDRHFFLWCIAHGVREFRVCMDAPFTKSRYQKGGQGSIPERMEKTGRAIARLATDFPALVGATGTLRIPWQFLLSMKDGATADRLVGGAMRSESALTAARVFRAPRVRRVLKRRIL